MTGLTYDEVGATGGELPAGYRHVRVERVVGRGPEAFETAADALLDGAVQRRSGAVVRSSAIPLRAGTRVDVLLRVGPLRFVAPCLVVWADRTDREAGFAYGTLPGHPERGEERFELRLADDGTVTFRIVAFSAPGRWFTRIGGPLARTVQDRMTQRYLRALDGADARSAGGARVGGRLYEGIDNDPRHKENTMETVNWVITIAALIASIAALTVAIRSARRSD